MSRFRKRPVEVDAMQWLGGAVAAGPVIDWVLATGGTARYHEPDYMGRAEGIWINTLDEGTMNASPGDWIIRGVEGEFYPCKPDIFEATYEPAPPEIGQR
jgi:hypothetical protein